MLNIEQILTTKPRRFDRRPPASPEEITQLQRGCRHSLPEAYLDLLRFSNGGEGPLPVQPYGFVCDDVKNVQRWNADPHYSEWLKDFVMIGRDGGGELIALDFRTPDKCTVVAIDATNYDLRESVLLIAPDFDAFLCLLGIEPNLPELPEPVKSQILQLKTHPESPLLPWTQSDGK